MEKVKIVLADWSGYPLRRKKVIGDVTIRCGLGNILRNMERHPPGVEFSIVLIINTPDTGSSLLMTLFKEFPYRLLFREHQSIERLIFRDNTGRDIGAYNEGYRYLRSINYEGDVVFMNSALEGPSHDDWLAKYHRLFHKREDIGLCGILMNSNNTKLQGSPFAPHVQSYFLYSNMHILGRVFGNDLCGAAIDDRIRLIMEGEIGMSQRILECGYGICCTSFEDFIYTKGDPWGIPFGDLRFMKEGSRFANRI